MCLTILPRHIVNQFAPAGAMQAVSTPLAQNNFPAALGQSEQARLAANSANFELAAQPRGGHQGQWAAAARPTKKDPCCDAVPLVFLLARVMAAFLGLRRDPWRRDGTQIDSPFGDHRMGTAHTELTTTPTELSWCGGI